MNKVVIEINNLSKQYRLGTISTGTLSQDISMFISRIRGEKDSTVIDGINDLKIANNNQNKIWALKDISLKVKRGEILGVIGRNGAGKSTLLKILSRITAPTRGNVKIKGRVASLLEVGTGFHPELTGKENVFLNGAILGMTKLEIDDNLDRIIEFSGIRKYINTPVKRYSSGMKVRLAFSVAAYLKADILLVDEVLAVGDLEFQKKCINYLETEGTDNRTVLFVSHRLQHIEELTKRTILFDKGNIIMDGKTDDVIMFYKDRERKELFIDNELRTKSSRIEINDLQIINPKRMNDSAINKGDKFQISVDYSINAKEVKNLAFLLTIEAEDGNQISGTKTSPEDFKKGTYKIRLFENILKYNWGDCYISIQVFIDNDVIMEFKRVKRISFKNTNDIKLLRYGGFLLNQMDYEIQLLE